MVKAMPDPYIPTNSAFYWYRQRVPKDVAALAKGKSASVVVDGTPRPLKIGAELKVTLATKDPSVAKVRARDVQSQFDLIWASFRSDEVTLSHKQVVALAGEIYRDWKVLEDNPGPPERWQRVRALNADALVGKPYKHPLTIGVVMVDPKEERFGPIVDIALNRHNLRITLASRKALLEQMAQKLDAVAELLGKRAEGDYSPDLYEATLPEFTPPASGPKIGSADGVTFEEIIRAETEHRRIGLGAKSQPLPEDTQRKYQAIARDFTIFRGSGGDRADTVTGEELEAFKLHLLTTPQSSGRINSARTVNFKVGNIKTLLSWGTQRFPRNQSLKEALASVQPVELPGFEKVRSDTKAIRPDEAVQILRMAREHEDPRVRWLPFLCAYSGARINEVATLHREAFIETEGLWFYQIGSLGRRSVKNANSVRYVPVHPALLEEGFRDFVESVSKGRLFGPDGEGKVRRWFWDKRGAGMTREGVAPNHGWRHLFEDLCYRDGVSDSAKNYMTGRVTPGSDQDYGKTFARLPGLYREISKVKPFHID